MNFDREAIYAALFALLWPAYAWKNTQATARRLKMWTEVDASNKPAFFQFEGSPENYRWSNNINPGVVLTAKLYIYTYTGDPDQIAATEINLIMNAIHTAMMPKITPGAQQRGAQTLGGLVSHARIEGEVLRVPGDIDAEGLIVVPISILVNA